MDPAEVLVLREWAEYAPWAQLLVQGDVVSARRAGGRQQWSIVAWPKRPASALGPGEVLVAANLGARIRSQLARKDQSYADRHALHLVGGGSLIHLERVGVLDTDESDRPRRATRPLPPSGVRAVQTMLIDGDGDVGWTVRRLAKEAEMSVGQAHQILSILEQADLVAAEGSGPTASRRVNDRGAVLDWLAQQPVALRSPLQCANHVYGRNGREVVLRATEGLQKADCRYAITGMAAASLVDLGPTELAAVHVWVDPERDVARVAPAAGMKGTSRGANVFLWSDADRSGTTMVELINGIAVASRPRVYLDLLHLPRGRDVAQTYRRVRLGY